MLLLLQQRSSSYSDDWDDLNQQDCLLFNMQLHFRLTLIYIGVDILLKNIQLSLITCNLHTAGSENPG